MIKMTLSALALGLAGVGVTTTPAAAQTPAPTYRQLDAGEYALVVRLTVLPEQRENFLRVMKARIADSRTHPAVVDFRILATADPLVFQGFESFTSRTAFQEFARTPQSQAFLAEMKSILARDLEVTFLTSLP
jgi:quinol monooxygenase YgiN